MHRPLFYFENFFALFWSINSVHRTIEELNDSFIPFLIKWCCYSCLLSQVLYIYDAMQFCETVKNITRFSPSIYHYNRMCTRSEQFLRPLPMGYIWQHPGDADWCGKIRQWKVEKWTKTSEKRTNLKILFQRISTKCRLCNHIIVWSCDPNYPIKIYIHGGNKRMATLQY